VSNIEGVSESVKRCQLADLDAPDAGGWWAVMTPGNVLLDGLGGAAHGGFNSTVVAVADPSTQAEPSSGGSRLGAIEDALHPPVNQQ